jgi:hypothetical protein
LGIPGGTAETSLDNWALTGTIGLVVNLGRAARWEVEVASAGVVSQTTESWES